MTDDELASENANDEYLHDAVTVDCEQCGSTLRVAQHRDGYAVECDCLNKNVDITQAMNDTDHTLPMVGDWNTVDIKNKEVRDG